MGGWIRAVTRTRFPGARAFGFQSAARAHSGSNAGSPSGPAKARLISARWGESTRTLAAICRQSNFLPRPRRYDHTGIRTASSAARRSQSSTGIHRMAETRTRSS